MKKIYNLFFILIIGLAVAIVVTAFTNPPGNPPTGGGTIGVGANAPANSIYVKSGGNVGIGTSAPATNLHLYKTGEASSTLGAAPSVLTLEGIDTAGWSGGEAIAELIFKKDGDIVGAIRSEHTRAGGPHSYEDAGLTFYVAPNVETPTAFEAMRIDYTGNVGIGTASPGAKLDIEGGNLDLSGNNIIGVNKISVNTIDPVFKINGQKYVTYAPDSIGQKVEVVGTAQLVNDEWSIDLAEQTANSDLWLFYQIVKPESIIPFVSSQSPASLYAFLEGSELVVKVKDGDPQTRFSYRLIGDRIDSQGNNYLLPATEANEVYIDVDSLKK